MNQIEQDCVKRYEKEDQFMKSKLEQFSKKLEAPKPPEMPEHPLGDDYLAVVELIGDWKKRALSAEIELASLRKTLSTTSLSFSDVHIKKEAFETLMDQNKRNLYTRSFRTGTFEKLK